jgi:acyl carrier protein
VPDIAQVVFHALSAQLSLTPEQVSQRAQEDLGALGLDSHGLMRVLLEIEKALGLARSLELDDAALATPQSMLDGVRAVAGST